MGARTRRPRCSGASEEEALVVLLSGPAVEVALQGVGLSLRSRSVGRSEGGVGGLRLVQKYASGSSFPDSSERPRRQPITSELKVNLPRLHHHHHHQHKPFIFLLRPAVCAETSVPSPSRNRSGTRRPERPRCRWMESGGVGPPPPSSCSFLPTAPKENSG